MRVEAIVRKNGLFIPNPGFYVGKQKNILVDLNLVSSEDESDSFIQAAGILKNTTVNAIVFQKKLRKEWKGDSGDNKC